MTAVARLTGAFAVAGLLALAWAAHADERIQGIVRDTVVTHCDATRRGGCAGTLTLEPLAGATKVLVTIQVPLGTPISRGQDRVLLHALEGQTVIVTQIRSRGDGVARAIQVVEPDAETAAGSTARDLC